MTSKMRESSLERLRDIRGIAKTNAGAYEGTGTPGEHARAIYRYELWYEASRDSAKDNPGTGNVLSHAEARAIALTDENYALAVKNSKENPGTGTVYDHLTAMQTFPEKYENALLECRKNKDTGTVMDYEMVFKYLNEYYEIALTHCKENPGTGSIWEHARALHESKEKLFTAKGIADAKAKLMELPELEGKQLRPLTPKSKGPRWAFAAEDDRVYIVEKARGVWTAYGIEGDEYNAILASCNAHPGTGTVSDHVLARTKCAAHYAKALENCEANHGTGMVYDHAIALKEHSGEYEEALRLCTAHPGTGTISDYSWALHYHREHVKAALDELEACPGIATIATRVAALHDETAAAGSAARGAKPA